MKTDLPKEVKEILSKFTNTGYQIYIVGGAVRDLILGREVTDWDFTTDAKPEEILKLFPDGYYDNKFGTVGIPFKTMEAPVKSELTIPINEGRRPPNEVNSRRAEGERTRDEQSESQGESAEGAVSEQVSGVVDRNDKQIFEITTMRKEGDYKDHRHPVEVGWTNKIKEDLARRDFTINAMALNCHPALEDRQVASSAYAGSRNIDSRFRGNDIQIIDPFHGQDDIKSKTIRTVGNPDKRFQEDALRLIRAIRIATQLEFDIEKNTFESIQKNAQLIKEVAFERIRDELFKTLSSANPYIGIVNLREAGILQIILPELERCFGIVQEGPKHDRVYDIGEHSLLSLKNTPSSDPLVRLAALLHDVGKPDTVSKASDGNVTFYNHDLVGGKIVIQIAKRFNLSKKQSDKLYQLVRWHLYTVDENQTDSAIRRFIKNVGLENIDDMLAVRVGDRLGGGTQKAISWRMEKFSERIKQVMTKPFSISDLKVNGKDVMETLNIKPGPRVGEILEKLFSEVLEDDSKNNREYLISRITKLES